MADHENSTKPIKGPNGQADHNLKTYNLDRYHEADGLQVDQATVTPQVAYSSEPQVVYSKNLPIRLDDHEEKEAALKSGANRSQASVKHLSRSTWIILVALVATVLAVGVGVGVGAGIEVSKRSSSSTTVPAGSGEASSTISGTMPTGTPQTLTRGILSDSSFAAVSGVDGSKYVFFQDASGSLRQACYSQTAQSWISDSSRIIPNTTDAKMHTPLSATINTVVDLGSSDEIFLFYISMNNSLAVKWYMQGSWTSDYGTDFVNVASFRASEDSRSLSVSLQPKTNNTEFLLYFESPGGNVSAFHGHKNLPISHTSDDVIDGPNPPWTWENITTSLQASANNLTFGAPFFSIFTNTSDGGTTSSDTLQSQAAFFDLQHKFAFTSLYFNGNESFVTPNLLETVYNGTLGNGPHVLTHADVFNLFTNITTIKASDFVPAVGYWYTPGGYSPWLGPYGYWVNGTTFSFLPSGTESSVTTPFPYTRMATIAAPNDDSYILYHQIDAVTIAQEIYEPGSSSWTSVNISITP